MELKLVKSNVIIAEAKTPDEVRESSTSSPSKEIVSILLGLVNQSNQMDNIIMRCTTCPTIESGH